MFDFQRENFAQNIQNELGNTCKIFDDKVKYSANRDLAGPPMLSVKNMDIDIQETVSTHFYTYQRELFFYKRPNWSYENEYRWLLHSIEEKNLYVSIQNAIIVGADFLIKLEPKLKSL